MMIKSGKLLGSAGIAALAVLWANPALAAGTQAGTTITNTVSVNYQVGGVAQTATTASNSFKVDRKVNVTVTEVGSATTQVTPGQSAAVTAFTVTNLSNAVLDFALAAAQQAGGAAAHAGTDTFNATGVKIYVDSNANGTYDPGIDLEASYLDELAADASATVFVVADIPLNLTTGAVAGVTLTATGREGGASGSQGAALLETSGADTANSVDTVFADGAGATDASRDAAYSARDDYTVLAAALTITKNSKVVSDPFNATTNPKAIPGATIEYCIVVTNAPGSATASSVAISDPLPAEVTYDSGYGIFLDGTVNAGACNADGTLGGSYGSGAVSGTLSSVAAGETKTLRFRVTIN